MIERIQVKDLAARYEGSARHLIARASFEKRSLVVARELARAADNTITGFASKTRSAMAEENFVAMSSAYSSAKLVELDTGQPLHVAAGISNVVVNIVGSGSIGNVTIDVSTFRREELLMLLAFLRQAELTSTGGCELVYVSTGDMSETLSSDVTGVRSVIGYAGVMRPSLHNRLVVLMGFEIQRARAIIESYEPSDIIIGIGRKSESISLALYEKNAQFAQELTRQSANVVGVFEFSAKDPLQVANELKDAVGDISERNLILAPLNTKLSTLGAGLFALSNPSVQICYAQVREYNEASYSQPGTDVYVIPLSDLL